MTIYALVFKPHSSEAFTNALTSVFTFECLEKWEILETLCGPGLRLISSDFSEACCLPMFEAQFIARVMKRLGMLSFSEYDAREHITDLQKLGVPIGIELRYTELAYQPYACVTGCWSQLGPISNNHDIDGTFVANALRFNFASEGVSK